MKRKPKGKSIFGRKVFTKEEENSLILFTAGMVFGISMVNLVMGGYTFTTVTLIILLLVLLYVDKRIQEE